MKSEWRVEKLEDCVDAIIDYRGKTPVKTTSGIPLITAKIVKNGRIEQPEEFIAFEDYDSWMTRGLPLAGDVVVTTEAPLGEVAQLPNQKIALAQRIILLRGKPALLDNTFLKYCFIDSFVQDQLHSRISGTTVTGIKQSELRKISLRLPPLPEQRAIAQVLAGFDDKIELNRRMNATLEAMAQTLFRAWFVDFEPVKAKAEGIAPVGLDAQTAALFPDSFAASTCGMIPQGWEVKRLEEAFEINPTRQLRKGSDATYLDMASVQTQGHRPAGWVQRKFSSGMKFTNGDTLLARITPCLENGKTAFVDFLKSEEIGWGSTEFIVLRPRLPLPEYFAYLLCRHEEFRAHAIQSMTGTSGRQRVQTSALGQYRLCVPDEPVCRAFATAIQPLAAQIAQNSTQSQTLAQMRDSLLPRLISGQLEISLTGVSE